MALEVQRRFGQFKTPVVIAKFMVRWAIRSHRDIVLDPCTGSGILLHEAIKRLKELGASGRIFKNIYGVDIDPFVTENLASTLGLHESIFCADFLKLRPSGDGSVAENNSELPLVNAVVCNPPYTRHQQFSQRYKKEIKQIIESESGVKFSGLSSIYVHFLIHATKFLKEDGRMVFLTPSNFLDVNYGVALKRFLLDNFRIFSITVFSEEELLFPKASTTACITMLEKESDRDNFVKFLKINPHFDLDKLPGLLKNDSALVKTNKVFMKKVSQFSLNPVKKWNRYFNIQFGRLKGFVLLGKIANVQRGIATGANEFFTLSDNMVKELRLEHVFLKPVLAKARDAPFYDFTDDDLQKLRNAGKRVWLLTPSGEEAELSDSNTFRYIEEGEHFGFHRRHLTSKRRVWYKCEKRVVAPILFTYMNRRNPRFIHNKAEIQVLNTFLCLYPNDKSIKEKTGLKAFLACLNSSSTCNRLRNIGRFYGGGLLKVEPKELEQLPVLDISKLREHDKETLATLFERLCTSSRQCRPSEVQKELDYVVSHLKQ